MKRARKVLENYQEITKKKMQNFLNRGNVPKKDRKVLGRYIPKSTKIKYWKSTMNSHKIYWEVLCQYKDSTGKILSHYCTSTNKVIHWSLKAKGCLKKSLNVRIYARRGKGFNLVYVATIFIGGNIN